MIKQMRGVTVRPLCMSRPMITTGMIISNSERAQYAATLGQYNRLSIPFCHNICNAINKNFQCQNIRHHTENNYSRLCFFLNKEV